MRYHLPSSRRLPIVMTTALALAFAGCSSGLQPVTGKVLYEDGTPVKGGSVTFNSKDKPVSATGEIADDGTFALTFDGHSGAAAGSYKVVVTGKSDEYGAPPTVDNLYGDPSKTPLTQDIVVGKNDLTIRVKRPAPTRPRP